MPHSVFWCLLLKDKEINFYLIALSSTKFKAETTKHRLYIDSFCMLREKKKPVFRTEGDIFSTLHFTFLSLSPSHIYNFGCGQLLRLAGLYTPSALDG